MTPPATPDPALLLPGLAYRSQFTPERSLLAVAGRTEHLTGQTAADLTGSPLTALVLPADRDRVWRSIVDGLRHDGCYDLEYCLLGSDGRTRLVQEHGEGIADAAGNWLELRGFIHDHSARHAYRERQQLAQKAIVRAAEHPLQGSGDIAAYARVLTRLVCETLAVRYTGIWLLAADGSSLRQLSVHDRDSGSDREGLELAAHDYPDYFAALMSGRAIDAEDACVDPRTREFRTGYLQPQDIRAMLDAAIRVDGNIVGIVCCEHTGRPRHWHADEISFAGEIADQMAQALILRDKQEALRQLQRERGSIRARTDFLARLSHEIRTPMNGVLGMAELLRQTRVSREQDEYLEVIEQSGRLLLHLVNDILDYAKIEAGKLAIRPRQCDPRALLNAIRRQFRARADAAGLELRLQLAGDLPDTVYCDAERVQQILVNLVGNALKFTPQGHVQIRATASNGSSAQWQVEVSDTGIGLAPELLNRLFEPFEQGEAPPNGGSRGTGLGLAIARSLAQLMGGTLIARSQRGSGASFTLTLPLQMQDHGEIDGQTTPTIQPARNPALRVLIVEDNEINRRVLLGMLERYFGIHAAASPHGEDALQRLARGEHYDLIFMDCEMPVLDGYETTRRIRSLPAPVNQVAIAAISAHAIDDMKDLAYAAGVDYYVTKPFGQEALAWVLRQVRDAGGKD